MPLTSYPSSIAVEQRTLLRGLALPAKGMEPASSG
jgi:hypothetical protein